jgi:PAS domain S-box-containing protein
MKDPKIYNVLIIEDSEIDFYLASFHLHNSIEAPTIIHAEDFETAQVILSTTSIVFDMVLLDIYLPDTQGEQLVTSILKLVGNCPVIILTGSNDVDFSIYAISLGVSDYLIKEELNGAILHKSMLYAIERKKNIIALKESEKRYSDLFQLSPQPMCLYQTETYRFIYVNEAAIKHYGYCNETLLNMTLLDLAGKDDRQKIVADELNQNRQLNQTYTGKFNTYKKNGELVEVETFSTPIMMASEKATLMIVYDITEKNLYQKKLVKAIINAQEDERYEIGANLQENICQVLVASQITLNMLKKSLQESHLGMYNQVFNYTNSVIQEIRTLSQKLAPVIFIDSTIEEAFKNLLKIINTTNEFKVANELSKQVKQFSAKEDFQLTLYRVLQELFNNIIKHANASNIRLVGNIVNDSILISIEDNGVGFDTKNVKYGFGLANINRRIALHQGEFVVQSSVGNGCKMHISVPVNAVAH